MDCPLDSLTICGICGLKNSMDCFPSLPMMKEAYQRDIKGATNLLKKTWKFWPTCMFQNYIPPFPYSHTQSLNTLPPWQLLQPQFNSYLPYPQGWNGISYDHMATQLGPLISTSQTNSLHQSHLSSHQTP